MVYNASVVKFSLARKLLAMVYDHGENGAGFEPIGRNEMVPSKRQPTCAYKRTSYHILEGKGLKCPFGGVVAYGFHKSWRHMNTSLSPIQ